MNIVSLPLSSLLHVRTYGNRIFTNTPYSCQYIIKLLHCMVNTMTTQDDSYTQLRTTYYYYLLLMHISMTTLLLPSPYWLCNYGEWINMQWWWITFMCICYYASMCTCLTKTISSWVMLILVKCGRAPLSHVLKTRYQFLVLILSTSALM